MGKRYTKLLRARREIGGTAMTDQLHKTRLFDFGASFFPSKSLVSISSSAQDRNRLWSR